MTIVHESAKTSEPAFLTERYQLNPYVLGLLVRLSRINMAFNAKNLSYREWPGPMCGQYASRLMANYLDTQEPAFLRRLRHEHQGSSPDARRTSVSNHRRYLKEPAEDDQPTYVVEGDGEIVSKADFDQMVSEPDIETQNAVEIADSSTKAISGEGEALQEPQLAPRCDATKGHSTAIGARIRKRQIKAVDESADVSCDDHSEERPQTKTKARRSKKIKLSFEDND